MFAVSKISKIGIGFISIFLLKARVLYLTILKRKSLSLPLKVDTDQFVNCLVLPECLPVKIQLHSQPRSQGLSSYRLGRARRDPGLVWSRATVTIEEHQGGVFCNQAVCRVELCRAVTSPPSHAMFTSSLRAEISSSVYSDVYLKVRKSLSWDN